MISCSRAPLRISFAGGGSDVEPFCTQHGGCVVSATIARYVWVKMDDSKRGYTAYPPDTSMDNVKFVKKLSSHFKPISLDVRVDAPHRSGLGGSGALGVAVVGCLNTLNKDSSLDLYQIAELAYHIEHNELKFSGGRQDQYASCFGGINFIRFQGDRVSVSRLDVRPETILALERSMFLVFTHPREKGNVIDEEISRVSGQDETTISALSQQKELANEVRKALSNGELTHFGELIDEAWQLKKKQTPSVTTGVIEELYKRVKRAGALGGKVSGAGAGGYFFIFAPGRESSVCEAITSLNLRPEPVILDWTGLKVWK